MITVLNTTSGISSHLIHVEMTVNLGFISTAPQPVAVSNFYASLNNNNQRRRRLQEGHPSLASKVSDDAGWARRRELGHLSTTQRSVALLINDIAAGYHSRMAAALRHVQLAEALIRQMTDGDFSPGSARRLLLSPMSGCNGFANLSLSPGSNIVTSAAPSSTCASLPLTENAFILSAVLGSLVDTAASAAELESYSTAMTSAINQVEDKFEKTDLHFASLLDLMFQESSSEYGNITASLQVCS